MYVISSCSQNKAEMRRLLTPQALPRRKEGMKLDQEGTRKAYALIFSALFLSLTTKPQNYKTQILTNLESWMRVCFYVLYTCLRFSSFHTNYSKSQSTELWTFWHLQNCRGHHVFRPKGGRSADFTFYPNKSSTIHQWKHLKIPSEWLQYPSQILLEEKLTSQHSRSENTHNSFGSLGSYQQLQQ